MLAEFDVFASIDVPVHSSGFEDSYPVVKDDIGVNAYIREK